MEIPNLNHHLEDCLLFTMNNMEPTFTISKNNRLTYTLARTDAIKFCEPIPDNSVDCIITDPAYESLEKHRAIGTTTRLKNEWFDIFPNSRFPELFQHFWRILKKNSHLYIMSDVETMFAIKPMGEQAGFKFWKPIVVNLMSIGMGFHYRNQATYVLFFEKGKRKLNNLGISDIIEAKRVRGYPTEKPLKVSETLILQSTNAGDIIFDPFMGSGSTGEAALKNNRHFIGNDLSQKAYDITAERLKCLNLINI